jgi:phosphoglycolate phosphatase
VDLKVASGSGAAAGGLVVGFDLDMTLIDSIDAIAATMAAAVAVSPGGAGVQITRENIWPWVGVPLEDTVTALAPQADCAAVVREYRARYASIGAPMVTLLPGARSAFSAVRAAGGRVLVVSAKAEPGVRVSLAQVGLDGPEAGPDLVVGGLFAAAKGECLLAERASVYVGDHPGDVEAARVAGAVSVAVSTGAHGAATLLAAGADVVLAALTEFPAWLSSFLPGFSRSRVAR